MTNINASIQTEAKQLLMFSRAFLSDSILSTESWKLVQVAANLNQTQNDFNASLMSKKPEKSRIDL